MTHDADVIIIGSGPAGVGAAWPLLNAGVRVLMLDASEIAMPAPPAHASLADWRRDPDRWQFEVGRDGPLAGANVSPKFATPLSRATLAGFAGASGLEARNYLAVGSLAAGGLSRIWGALAVRYTPAELARFPGGGADMEAGYARVADRIGVSEGAAPLTPAVARLAAGHRGLAVASDFSLMPAPNAVLAAPRGDRLGCTACGLCLHGCGRGSIYHSAMELPALRRFANFDYRAGVRVERLTGGPGAHGVEARFLGEPVRFQAPVVILAAGTLMSTSLAFRRIGHTGRRVRLQNNPVGGAAFVVPSLVGRSLPDNSFGLGQLFYTLRDEAGGEAAGVFYGADTLPLTPIADRLPFTRPTALRMARALAPALLLATGYLPGVLSDNSIIVDDDGGAGRIRIEGGQSADTDTLLRRTFRQLGRQVRRRGAWPVPGSVQLLGPGADAHPAATLPMGAAGPAATSASGELNAVRGIYVADGAALPFLSARHPTLTIMANADRIGQTIARRLTAAPDLARAG